MAKIKSKIYKIDGEDFEVVFNCSKSGVFSVNLKTSMQSALNLENRLEADNLVSIESQIDKAFKAYETATHVEVLKIGIRFGVSGDFKEDENDDMIDDFKDWRGKFMIDGFSGSNKSQLAFDFRVILEENRAGNVRWFEMNKPHPNAFKSKRSVNGYDVGAEIRSLKNETVIDFSIDAVNNLTSIKNQLKKARDFILNLVKMDDPAELLSKQNVKLLN